MTNDDGRKPEGAPERSPQAGAGAPSGVETRNWDYRYPAPQTAPPRREPAGFATPFRSHPTLKFSAEVFPLLGTSS